MPVHLFAFWILEFEGKNIKLNKKIPNERAADIIRSEGQTLSQDAQQTRAISLMLKLIPFKLLMDNL
jgi:hypothetical protein